jgi:disulfide bond formation protein DsbB
VLAFAQWIALLLVPKCPLCIAAQLSLFGVSAGVAYAIAPLMYPLSLAASALGLGYIVVRAYRALASARPHRWLRGAPQCAQVASTERPLSKPLRSPAEVDLDPGIYPAPMPTHARTA